MTKAEQRSKRGDKGRREKGNEKGGVGKRENGTCNFLQSNKLVFELSMFALICYLF